MAIVLPHQVSEVHQSRNMSFGYKLEITLPGIVAVVILQRALYIGGVGIVAFDKVAVITVHCAHQVGKGGSDAFGQGASESG